jgi:NCAIR mutase (PurE)-related protein
MERLTAGPGPVLATRATPQIFAAVQQVVSQATYNDLARTIVYEPEPLPRRSGTIMVITAGTSDIPVAEEAAVTAEVMGNPVDRLFDVGVAGLHRLLADMDRLLAASVLIVVAGMEGALPSVVGGLVRRPVIAVPTSVGYGASFGGIAALLGMLNSCASGVTVVNIDNGFGAGFAASLMNGVQEE